MELSIDSSTRYASVGLSVEGKTVHEVSWRADMNHSVELTPAVMRLFEATNSKPSDLTAVFVSKGPGGFSALRVGMSLAKSLAMALDIPIVAVETLVVEAAPYLGQGTPVWAAVGATRKQFYLGAFPANADENYSPKIQVVDREALLAKVTAPAVLCGEAADGLRADVADGITVPDAVPPTRAASTLARLAYARLRAGQRDDAAALQPLYIRSSQEMAATQQP